MINQMAWNSTVSEVTTFSELISFGPSQFPNTFQHSPSSVYWLLFQGEPPCALILSGKQSHWNQGNGMQCIVRIVRGGTKKKAAGRYNTCWIGQLPFLVTWSVVKYKDINQQISFTAKDGLYDQLPSFHFCCMTPATFKQLMVQVFPCRNHPLVNGKSPWDTTSRTEASWKETLTV